MPRLGWLPQADGQGHGSCTPIFGVLHSMIGTYDGSYQEGLDGYFHFAVAKDGRGVQFVDTNELAYHVGGPNPCSVGIEFEGSNYDYLNGEAGIDPLTPQQIDVGGHIIRDVSALHGIPLTYYGPPGAGRGVTCSSGFRGWASHVNCDSSPADQHFDFVSGDQFALMAQTAPSPPPVPLEEEDTMVSTYRFGDNIRTVCVDDKGNVKHRWFNGTAWVTEILLGPNSTGPVKDAALVGSAKAEAGGYGGGPNRVDVFAQTTTGKQLHAYWTGKAWLADSTP